MHIQTNLRPDTSPELSLIQTELELSSLFLQVGHGIQCRHSSLKVKAKPSLNILSSDPSDLCITPYGSHSDLRYEIQGL